MLEERVERGKQIKIIGWTKGHGRWRLLKGICDRRSLTFTLADTLVASCDICCAGTTDKAGTPVADAVVVEHPIKLCVDLLVKVAVTVLSIWCWTLLTVASAGESERECRSTCWHISVSDACAALSLVKVVGVRVPSTSLKVPVFSDMTSDFPCSSPSTLPILVLRSSRFSLHYSICVCVEANIERKWCTLIRYGEMVEPLSRTINMGMISLLIIIVQMRGVNVVDPLGSFFLLTTHSLKVSLF